MTRNTGTTACYRKRTDMYRDIDADEARVGYVAGGTRNARGVDGI